MCLFASVAVYSKIPEIADTGDSVTGLVFWGHKWINKTSMGFEVFRESMSFLLFSFKMSD